MNTRNPIEVIDRMLAEIPDGELGLRMIFTRLKEDAKYKAPEQAIEVFTCMATILGNHIPKIESPWQQAVVDIFEDRNEWRVFAMNDCDWYMGRCLTDAVDAYSADHPGTPVEELLSDPHLVSDEEMDRLQYFPEGARNGTFHSFRSELLRRIHAGPKAEMFATTEF